MNRQSASVYKTYRQLLIFLGPKLFWLMWKIFLVVRTILSFNRQLAPEWKTYHQLLANFKFWGQSLIFLGPKLFWLVWKIFLLVRAILSLNRQFAPEWKTYCQLFAKFKFWGQCLIFWVQNYFELFKNYFYWKDYFKFESPIGSRVENIPPTLGKLQVLRSIFDFSGSKIILNRLENISTC